MRRVRQRAAYTGSAPDLRDRCNDKAHIGRRDQAAGSFPAPCPVTARARQGSLVIRLDMPWSQAGPASACARHTQSPLRSVPRLTRHASGAPGLRLSARSRTRSSSSTSDLWSLLILGGTLTFFSAVRPKTGGRAW